MTMTRGAIQSLIKKIHKTTAGTGMKDDVKAVIKRAGGGSLDGGEMGDQPAALSEGEYVIPADVVSMLGDGNSDAGAKILEQFCKQIRQTKGKHLAQGKQAPPLT
jgi:hypothetical protein